MLQMYPMTIYDVIDIQYLTENQYLFHENIFAILSFLNTDTVEVANILPSGR